MKQPGRRTLMCALAFGVARPALADPMSVREVIALLRRGQRADLAGRDLSRLDLAELDFRGANLTSANLFGADLSGAKLAGANLAGANLDRATIIRADFSGANLSGARMFLPAASSRLGENPAVEAPAFRHANLSGAHLLAKLAARDRVQLVVHAYESGLVSVGA